MKRLLAIAILLAPSICIGATWQNPSNHLDVNNSSTVTGLDALMVVNRLLTDGPGPLPTVAPPPPPYYDVNGDDFFSPIDLLQLANHFSFGGGRALLPEDS